MIAMNTPQRLASSAPPGWLPPSAASQGPTPELARVPVLIIEDEAMIAWQLESLLEDMGFKEIALASDAVEAAGAVKGRKPELVISDINLGPGPDGIEVVGAIRNTCSPAVVFVSGYIDESARSRISEQVAGARVLAKPLNGDKLSDVIRDVLGLNRAN
ncbi:response regulator [Altericroceibacterium xinjiangense]|uniref:response regulator n=1 Tax=Altericroceibacterium xinjiangense TaxID=762261 RepID=UPI0013E0A04A|nr:response regulator [Altericroceibacterium xinjiangense]